MTSVRARILRGIVLTMALVLAVLGVIIYFSTRALLLANVDADLIHRGEHFARLGRMMPPDGPPPFPPPFPRFERGVKGGVRFRGVDWWFAPRMFALDGAPLSGADEPFDRSTLKTSTKGEVFSTITVDDEPGRVLSMPLRNRGTVVGVVQIAHPLTDTYLALNGLLRTLLMLIPVTLLIAGVGGALLTGRVLRPVRDITNAAQNISSEDLSQRLPVDGKDEFGELAQTFNEMLGRLQAAFNRMELLLENQRRFTADASHELRTPLTTVKASASLALTEEQDLEGCRRLLLAIHDAANTMNKMVMDLLMLARSDGGQLGQNKQQTPLKEIIARAAEVVVPMEQAPLHVDVSESLDIIGNEDELVRLFSYLLENAARHTPVDGSIFISANPTDDRVMISVKDTGEGIPPEHLSKVCERFYRVDSARTRNGAHGGTGLGLAICKSIVDAHGGTMQIASEVRKGTTVDISFPHGGNHGEG